MALSQNTNLRYRKLIPRNGHNVATVHLIGVCHVSEESAMRVSKTINDIQPTKVFLELCESRRKMLDPELDKPTKPLPPILEFIYDKPKIIFNPLFWFMQVPQMGIEALTWSSAGREMRAAVSGANQIKNCEVIFIDRPISITLIRTVAKMIESASNQSVWNFVSQSETQPKEKQTYTIEEQRLLDKFTSIDGLFELLNASKLPQEEFIQLQLDVNAMIDLVIDGKFDDVFGPDSEGMKAISEERDHILGFNCFRHALNCQNQHMVAVVGAAHLPGIEKEWDFLTQPRPFSQKTIFSEEYISSMKSLFDEKEALETVAKFSKNSMIYTGVSLGVYVGGFHIAKRRGGGVARAAILLRRAAFGIGGLSTTMMALGATTIYNEVRELQMRRLDSQGTTT